MLYFKITSFLSPSSELRQKLHLEANENENKQLGARRVDGQISKLYEATLPVFFVRNLLKDDQMFYVPEVIEELSSKEVLTHELVNGLTLDKMVDADQNVKNMVRTYQLFEMFCS